METSAPAAAPIVRDFSQRDVGAKVPGAVRDSHWERVIRGRIGFELIPDATGKIAALRVRCATIDARVAALISRLGLAEACVVDNAALVYCTEAFAQQVTATRRPLRIAAGIPRGIGLFFFADHA